ncbi:glycoside hydrolase family 15 protein [Acidithiobacillus caldus]|uniref:glycoside hydrolase family 15 protein n=1 Tax=Acidithiobacillus caldus TaxID=33059 RepID=UPI0029BFF471|nr:glycoside hydrolase family 15 protein [Acidithiobacillus caldus]
MCAKTPSLPPSGQAFGAPGLIPNWASGRKMGIGTARGDASRVWFTLADGILTECYYPSVDTPNQRDLQLLILDQDGGFQEERRDLAHTVHWIEEGVPAFEVVSWDPRKRYRLVKRFCTDPDRHCILEHIHFDIAVDEAAQFRLFALWAPQIGNLGTENKAHCRQSAAPSYLSAWRENAYAVLSATVPFRRMSVGYVGVSDGWQDLHQHKGMDWSFAEAGPGHVALTAELDLKGATDFTLAIGFAESEDLAMETVTASLSASFDSVLKNYSGGWRQYQSGLHDLSAASEDQGLLYRRSVAILRSHFDKRRPGAGVAALSIPWGDSADASIPQGGYHLVWPRDLYHMAMGLLAAGDHDAPTLAWTHLQSQQQEDGSWSQNFWTDGAPYWQGLQLDEVAYPILLAWRLFCEGLISDPASNIKRAADFLVGHGPVTPQDRWEENRGYSPQTLAVVIAGLRAAASLFELQGHSAEAIPYRKVADGWDAKLEDWTFTHCGHVIPDHPEHYERIAQIPPADTGAHLPECRIYLPMHNLPPEAMYDHSQCCVVDGGFLALVRLGLRAPDDPHVLKTLPVWDAACRHETPYGPCWHRYNGDSYGEHEDGRPFDGTGIGRLWPLLTGERGHYELAMGRDIGPYVRAMESFANEGGMIPEQIWDSKPIPERHLHPGRGTGSATPLAWAHAEYIRLLRSRKDEIAFDRPQGLGGPL